MAVARITRRRDRLFDRRRGLSGVENVVNYPALKAGASRAIGVAYNQILNERISEF